MTDSSSLSAALAGRYTIERQLGTGGMANVYLARDVRHDREVALKVLKPELAAALGARRFLAEIKITAQLDHPRILTLIDSGESGGLLWYVMPFVHGESLRDKLARETQLPLDQALTIARQVASALDYAHRQGVVHRDIKPENILLHEGEAMLTDFGIALAVREAGGSRLTETGYSLGTPQYVSPEQATGDRQLDARSDVYSLGVVVYEMLAGEPPATGPTFQAVIAKLLTERPVPLRTVRDTVPLEVEAAVLKALARTPADRFASAGEFVAALQVPAAVARPASGGPSHRAYVIAATGGALALAVSAVLFVRRPAPRVATAAANSVAVLYFDNLSPDTADAYLADGLTEEIIVRLGQVVRLGVKSRNAVLPLRGQAAEDPAVLGRRLGVAYLVSGTTQRSGSRVRVAAELVRTSNGLRVWGEVFDRNNPDLMAIESDIAAAVATAIAGRLAPSERSSLTARSTSSPEAYDLYLRGLYFWQKRTPADLERAREAMERATELDSTFALAFADLANVYDHLGFIGGHAPREVSPKARAAALRALQLDSTLPEAHAALAYVQMQYDWDWPAAERSMQQALQLDPRYVEGHRIYAYWLAAEGRGAEGIAEAERALALDPLDHVSNIDLGRVLAYAGRYDRALAQGEEMLARDSNDAFAHDIVGMAYRGLGRRAEAVAEFRRAGDSGQAILTSRDRDALLREIGRLKGATPTPAFDIAMNYAVLGDRDQVFEWLDRAYGQRDGLLMYLQVNPTFDALRSDPRYAALLRKLHP